MRTTPLAPWLPNPDCCNTTDPDHLCERCRAALARSHPRPIYAGVNSEEDDDDDIPTAAEVTAMALNSIWQFREEDLDMAPPKVMDILVNERQAQLAGRCQGAKG